MSKKWLVVIGAAVLSGLLLVGVVGVVLAQGPQPGQPPVGPGYGWVCGGCGMRGLGFNWHQTMLETAAKALGLTPDELTAEFQAGKTLAQIAKERGVELADVQKALLDARKTALDKAVADGLITQEQADWMLDHMQSMWQDPDGDDFGPGWGMMGRGWGRGRGMRPGWGRGTMGQGYQAQ